MAAAYQQQLIRICGKEETLKDAKDLLNIARSKTGAGSGHDLGKSAIALPAICAFLASERLGNNDVVKKVAQDVSCLKPKDFEAALSTVRGAISGYLSRRHGKNISYQTLCRSHGLNEDSLYWMEEVDKELRKSEELDDLEVDDESIIYVVFYWTCIALNIRSVKQATIISEYKVPLRELQEIEAILEVTCRDLKESMGKFIGEARTARSTLSTPSRSLGGTPTKLSRDMSPSKGRVATASTLSSSPTKTPTKASTHVRDTADGSPTKRKAVLPPLPFMTPTKKQKTTSPLKLNRLPVASNISTPTKSGVVNAPVKTSPTKTYANAKSFVNSPTKPIISSQTEETSVPTMQSDKLDTSAELPTTPAKPRTILQRPKEQTTPSPRKSARMQSAVAGPSTLTCRMGRYRRTPVVASEGKAPDTRMNTTVTGAESESLGESEDDEVKEPPCRHIQPVFADRLFYRYRDPKVKECIIYKDLDTPV
ncbi:uncharacterized protein FOMMEDRAFT_157362 [Fomitiporia mediterranea MF3/22]|uniref:uncharacterized protein n=1 Tax=Fomitiporia mediterranea (strain MF3/22) TaxID=694068 RepID=UPI000440869A|nr:uncharacterized protein FOMMEDRAFT_157362 [Fomitiporia mediterranea MF3/22]EJD02164.1 hypothetical protein FOMMEDRAFT_157362 [Fomitiporia mediterranea MF3/22]